MDEENLEIQLYPGLEKLSLEELEELLRQDIDVFDEFDMDYIMAIVEVMERRTAETSDYKHFDVKAGWKYLEENYISKRSDRLHISPLGGPQRIVPDASFPEVRKHRHFYKLRRTVVIAATLALLIGMLTAQALGYNVFQSIAQWSSDVFTFGGAGAESTPSPNISTEISADMQNQSIQNALNDFGIFLHVVPLWYPYGFTQTGLTVTRLPEQIVIRTIYEKENQSFSMRIAINIYPYSEHFLNYEINDFGVSTHETGGITHYIMSNYDRVVAVWINENLEVTIQGDITEAELLKMIDSIYGG